MAIYKLRLEASGKKSRSADTLGSDLQPPEPRMHFCRASPPTACGTLLRQPRQTNTGVTPGKPDTRGGKTVAQMGSVAEEVTRKEMFRPWSGQNMWAIEAM